MIRLKVKETDKGTLRAVEQERVELKNASTLVYVNTGVLVDPTLSISGQAADAKVVGDRIADIETEVGNASLLLSLL